MGKTAPISTRHVSPGKDQPSRRKSPLARPRSAAGPPKVPPGPAAATVFNRHGPAGQHGRGVRIGHQADRELQKRMVRTGPGGLL